MERILNLLVVNNTDYAKLAFVNVNSLHRFNPNQKYRIYCDENNFNFIREHSSKFSNPESTQVINCWSHATENWQKLKLDILGDYLHKEDACILDADSIFTSNLEPFPNDKILFLNSNKDTPTYKLQKMWFLKDYLPDLKETTQPYQIGIFNYPLALHTELFLDECKKTCEIIRNLPDKVIISNKDVKRQCEQIALSIMAQKYYPNNITFFKEHDTINHRHKMESLYWSCRGTGWEAGQHKLLLKQYGW